MSIDGQVVAACPASGVVPPPPSAGNESGAGRCAALPLASFPAPSFSPEKVDQREWVAAGGRSGCWGMAAFPPWPQVQALEPGEPCQGGGGTWHRPQASSWRISWGTTL